ncbi:MAG: adenylate/guanylate cyclase domain-containing protein [Nitrosopumilus sp. B06]|nr:MAG: adenylate/guanylate cyclase domain-containing protein [Nitrosopumilus sp. D6]RNJ80135.1 MAG: adenylate/guanylate cyclase domain-containing protein [Nitrosopumilus sp. B06]
MRMDEIKQKQGGEKPAGQGIEIVDMLLGKRGEKVLDSETMILEIQKRVWGSLKKGYEYSGIVDESDRFLRKNVFATLDMMVLYVDLVGSTTMTLEMPAEKIAIIVSSFAQEMATVIRQHRGFVLKFVGDAVIGYFVAKGDGPLAADNAVSCAKSMITVIQKGINPILNQYDYPDLMVKVGVDYGQNLVVRYGADVEHSHVDLMGPAMNIAAKIQGMAKPNQILIGEDVHKKLHPSIGKEFSEIIWKNSEWKYHARSSGNLYRVFEYKTDENKH